MLRITSILLRKGQPRPSAASRPSRFSRIPVARRPHQGGQPHFQADQLRKADEDAAKMRNEVNQTDTKKWLTTADLKNPHADFQIMPDTNIVDGFLSRRSYNERSALSEIRKPDASTPMPRVADVAGASSADVIPENVLSDESFASKFGYSLVKPRSGFLSPAASYSSLDLWAEQPKYTRGTYFLYLIARRRNVYAVFYDFDGKRVHPTYSVGNRGLKGSDKGFKADGAAENAHIVTSQYINDALPRIYEKETDAGRMRAGEKKKIDVVVRVMGFYNGRAGSIRAVTDRQDVLNVRYFEDITPFPLNGPRMPKSKKSN